MVFDGVAGGGGSGGDADFAVNRGQVRIDRARTDDQAFSYLLIRQAFCYNAQHFHLAGR